jgi:hypothetical protein
LTTSSRWATVKERSDVFAGPVAVVCGCDSLAGNFPCDFTAGLPPAPLIAAAARCGFAPSCAQIRARNKAPLARQPRLKYYVNSPGCLFVEDVKLAYAFATVFRARAPVAPVERSRGHQRPVGLASDAAPGLRIPARRGPRGPARRCLPETVSMFLLA